MDDVESEKLVGPVLTDLALADAVIAAMEVDNPGQELVIEDQVGYVRVHLPKRIRLTQASLEQALGRPFRLTQLEAGMSAFAGRIKVEEDEIVWYLEREE